MGDGDELFLINGSDLIPIRMKSHTHKPAYGFLQNDSLTVTLEKEISLQPFQECLLKSESGAILFRGFCGNPSGGFGRNRTYKFVETFGLLKRRYAANISYSFRPSEESDVVTLADLFSASPPSQDSGPTELLEPIFWSMQSQFPVGSEYRNQTTGVKTFANVSSYITGRDIYVGGNKCTRVYSLDDLTTASHQYCILGSNLHVFGATVKDYRRVSADMAFDYHVRPGTLPNGDRAIYASIDIEVEPWHTALINILYKLQLYPKIRLTEDYIYVDCYLDPPVRGTKTSPFYIFDTDSDDVIDYDTKYSNDITPNVLTASGAGVGITTEYVSICDKFRPGPLVEVHKTFSEEKLAPFGQLKQLAQYEYEDAKSDRALTLYTKLKFFKVGDWTAVILPGGKIFSGQVKSMERDDGPIVTLSLGATGNDVESSMLQAQESEAANNFAKGLSKGTVEHEELLGPTNPFSLSFTGTDQTEVDAQRALLKFEMTDSTDISFVRVNCTINVNGSPILLPSVPWGGVMFDELNVGEFLAWDGSTESIEISITDLTNGLISDEGDKTFAATLTLYGRATQTACATLSVDAQTYDNGYTDINPTVWEREGRDWEGILASSDKLEGEISDALPGGFESFTTMPGVGNSIYISNMGESRVSLSDADFPDYASSVVLCFNYRFAYQGIYAPYNFSAYIKPYIYISGVKYFGPTIQYDRTVGGSSFYQQNRWSILKSYEHLWEVNPAAGNPWNTAVLASLEAGFQVAGNGGGNMMCMVRLNNFRVELR
jgi:hypothetical protein